VLTQDAYRRLQNLRVFLRFRQSLASEASEDSSCSANEEFFLPYDVRTDVRRFQLKACKQTGQSFFLAILAGVQNMREYSYTVSIVQAQVAQRAG